MTQEVETMEPKVKGTFSIITFFTICLVTVTTFSVLRYMVFKNYDMTIEVACDSEREHCFTRSCVEGDCPPNELENYKKYLIKGFLFDKCEEDTCKHFCENPRNCEQIECDSGAGDTCSG